MNLKAFLYFQTLLLWCCPLAMADKMQDLQTFVGVIEERPWMRSDESYCHGGSRYYVLRAKEATYVIGSERTLARVSQHQMLSALLPKLLGHSVQAKGVVITKRYDPSEHCVSASDSSVCQSGSITCSWLEIADIKQRETK